MDRETQAEGHRLIRAPLHRVWQLLSRLESHPRYTNLWLTADLLERSQTSAVVEFRGFFGGLPITSVQRVVLRPPGRIEFKQVRGTLRGFWGAYVLRDAEGETSLAAQVSADPGIIFFPEASVYQILTAHIDGTLNKIKASAERDLTRPPSARRAAAEDDRGGKPAPSRAGVEAAQPEDFEDGEAEAPGDEPAEDGAQTVGAPEPSEPRLRRRRRRRRRRRGGAPRPPAPAA